MNKVLTETLFNRALLWMIIADLSDNRYFKVFYLLCATFNIYKSFKKWSGA